jgi:hypothetical protein
MIVCIEQIRVSIVVVAVVVVVVAVVVVVVVVVASTSLFGFCCPRILVIRDDCFNRIEASNPKPAIDPVPSASPLSETVVAPTAPVVFPTELPWSPPPRTCCATCSQCTSRAVDPPPPPIVD